MSDLNFKINSPDQATIENSKPKIEIISDLNSNCQLSTPGEETTRPVENVALTTKGLQERNTNIIAGTTVDIKVN